MHTARPRQMRPQHRRLHFLPLYASHAMRPARHHEQGYFPNLEPLMTDEPPRGKLSSAVGRSLRGGSSAGESLTSSPPPPPANLVEPLSTSTKHGSQHSATLDAPFDSWLQRSSGGNFENKVPQLAGASGSISSSHLGEPLIHAHGGTAVFSAHFCCLRCL